MIRRVTTATLVSLLVATFVAGQLSGLLHDDALVQHETCDEHGEQIHVGYAGATVAATDGAVRRGAERQREGHDHCNVSSLSRQRYAVVAAGAPVVHVALGVRVPAHTAGVPRRGAGAYRYAPKQSPPTV